MTPLRVSIILSDVSISGAVNGFINNFTEQLETDKLDENATRFITKSVSVTFEPVTASLDNDCVFDVAVFGIFTKCSIANDCLVSSPPCVPCRSASLALNGIDAVANK